MRSESLVLVSWLRCWSGTKTSHLGKSGRLTVAGGKGLRGGPSLSMGVEVGGSAIPTLYDTLLKSFRAHLFGWGCVPRKNIERAWFTERATFTRMWTRVGVGLKHQESVCERLKSHIRSLSRFPPLFFSFFSLARAVCFTSHLF